MAASSPSDPIPDHVLGFWRALDAMFGRAEPTWWGAVVTDGRYPAVWDANYARIDVADDTLTVEEVEGSLLPALHEAGVTTEHLVCFHPERCAGLLRALRDRGHSLTWDLVMDLEGAPAHPSPSDRHGRVDEIADGPELWDRVLDSLALFDVGADETVAQLGAIERDVLGAGGKRWFGIRDEHDELVSLGAVMVLDGVGYVDNVATFPHARGRGLASAVAAALARAARAEGAYHVCLFADPVAAPVVRMYERLGFRRAGMLAATRGPVRASGAP
ncbi:MAG: GNAT family N-acetyltransferase [Actinomycetota bacterium]